MIFAAPRLLGRDFVPFRSCSVKTCGADLKAAAVAAFSSLFSNEGRDDRLSRILFAGHDEATAQSFQGAKLLFMSRPLSAVDGFKSTEEHTFLLLEPDTAAAVSHAPPKRRRNDEQLKTDAAAAVAAPPPRSTRKIAKVAGSSGGKRPIAAIAAENIFLRSFTATAWSWPGHADGSRSRFSVVNKQSSFSKKGDRVPVSWDVVWPVFDETNAKGYSLVEDTISFPISSTCSDGAALVKAEAHVEAQLKARGLDEDVLDRPGWSLAAAAAEAVRLGERRRR